MLLDPDASSRELLAAAIRAAGGDVASSATAWEHVEHVAAARALDVAVLAAPVIGAHAREGLLRLAAGCPVVLVATEEHGDTLVYARTPGVMACLVRPVRAAQLLPTLDLAVARFRDVRLLREKLKDRGVIDRAKGRLMERYRLTEEQAFRRMRRRAMDTRCSLGAVARALLAELPSP